MVAKRSTPSIAVITPTKNRLSLLLQALDSVAAQSFADWQHVVVDDGSDDGTAEEMARRCAADPRIRYLQRTAEASGANVCRNIGLRETSAEFVVFLDSDDLLEPDCLGRRVEVMRRNADLDFATFQTGIFVGEVGDMGRQLDDQLLGDDLVRFLYFECPWIITGPVWRRRSLVALGGFDETLLSWQDIELHVRALTRGLRYIRFPEIDHHVRWQDEPGKVSIDQRRSPRHLEGAAHIIETFEDEVRKGPGMNWVRQRALCGLYFFVAERWVAIGETRKALDFWKRVQSRGLGSWPLYLSGAGFLLMQGAKIPCQRLVHKWRGWMRLRTNPEVFA